ncbi:SLBB domain-containing protein [Pseudoalteromonas pernae]|uniref:SLBB domain-containing protein n=1 Tax=Pseudoalteromonas pernae TaxID=3118054 RepID=UPI003242BE50
MKFLKLIIITYVLVSSALLQAQTRQPTEAQIEQFKKLPKSQQEAIAKKYGIDLNVLGQSNDASAPSLENTPSVLERRNNESGMLTDSEVLLLEEQRFKPKGEELKPFGYELFAGEPTTFMPTEGALVPDSYTVGPGDSLNVTLYGKQNSSQEVIVDREGLITISGLSPVQVAGMQYVEVKKLIQAKVEEEIIGAQAFVSMGRLRSIRVLVLGEAYKPGAYTVPSLASITHALFVSGGITEIGSLRNIQLKRAGNTIVNLDLYDLLLSGDSSGDALLKPGDVVFIPPVGKQVAVSGEVRRPAVFELQKGESAKDLIAMAGGFNATALTQKATVERFSGNNFKTILPLDLSQPEVNYAPKSGDKIIIPKSAQELNQAITLVGAVSNPGNFAWKSDSYISTFISSLKADLLPIADFEYALVVREKNAKGDIGVVQFSPEKAITGDPQHNIALLPGDKVVVFSQYKTKADEEQVLASMALTQEQMQLNEKVELWQEYENRKFYDFIGETKELDSELSKAVSERDFERGDRLNSLLLGKELSIHDEDYSVFSREVLLEPIIMKLSQQASHGEYVQLFEIKGEVRYPGIYPLPANGTLSEAVDAAGGLKESAYLNNAEITRLVKGETASVEHVNFNLKASLSGEEQYRLQGRDSINIFSTPNWQESINVRLVGEVKFPGTYTIKRGETLNDLLTRAGGFTDYAFPEGAIFTREEIRLQEQRQLRKLSDDLRREMASRSFQSSVAGASLSYGDMDRLLKDLADIDALGRLVVDIEAVAQGNVALELRDNDALYVPSKRNIVSVIGEVNVSTSHYYEDGMSVDAYIKRSGGLKQRADEERIYIIKANGAVEVPESGSWFAVENSSQLEPGDTIVVPLDAEYTDTLTLWSTATQILYQVGVAVAAIGSL